MKRKIYEIIEMSYRNERLFGVWYSTIMLEGLESRENFLQVFSVPLSLNIQEFMENFEANDSEYVFEYCPLSRA